MLEPTIAVALPTLAPTSDEASLVAYHLRRLASFETTNKVKEAYYDGVQRVRNLGISVPPDLRDIEVVVGWPGTTVDVLEERLDWLGWVSDQQGADFGLNDIYIANGLDVDSGLGHLDALIYGTAFVMVGSGDPGEPNPLITIESPRRVTGEWDGRLRRLSSALSVDEFSSTGTAEVVTLYLPNENITMERVGGGWKVADREDREGRDQHNAGRVLVTQLVNRPRASRTGGRSEITPAVRSYTDQGVRTLLGMEVNREFYSAPQRYGLGMDAGAFTDKDGNVKTGWEAIMGRWLAIPRDEDGEIPTVGQFPQATPGPYLEQVRGLSQLLSAEAAIPQNYLGFSTDNPPSADAIRAMEARLIKRAERRQTIFGRAWREVAAQALLVRDGAIPDNFNTISVKWRDAATPTRSAAADEATKLIATGVLPPDSVVTYDRLGLSPQEQRQLASDKRRAAASNRLTALAAAAEAARQDEDVTRMEAPNGERE